MRQCDVVWTAENKHTYYMIFELADTMVIQNNEIVVLHLSKTKPLCCAQNNAHTYCHNRIYVYTRKYLYNHE